MTLLYSLLDEPLIGVRLAAEGRRTSMSLPTLFQALAGNQIRDFPALRPHQRHPWHAFLVQLAALTLHQGGRDAPLEDEQGWREALLALTPDDPDGAAWCLVAPIDRPAFLQAPVPEGSLEKWANDTPTPDKLDILVTSKNHDLKQERAANGGPEDWIYSLVSVQTAGPFPGKGNYGVSRMNGGSSSRPGLGVEPSGGPGRRWLRDLRILLDTRSELVTDQGYKSSEGIALLWLAPWDGASYYGFSGLDPFYIEICRRIRLQATAKTIFARRTSSKVPRISKAQAKARKGNTGDPWTPIEKKSAKSLGVSSAGFRYDRMVELLFGANYQPPPAQRVWQTDDQENLRILARAIAGGQSKTEGYHERRVPISKRMRQRLVARDMDPLAALGNERVQAIAKLRSVLWSALVILFDNGAPGKELTDGTKEKASRYALPFEQGEDARFFDGPLGLNAEIESDDPRALRRRWYRDMAERAETILVQAFDAGPRSAQQRYRARAKALNRLRGGLRSDKVLPDLAQDLRNRTTEKETQHDGA